MSEYDCRWMYSNILKRYKFSEDKQIEEIIADILYQSICEIIKKHEEAWETMKKKNLTYYPWRAYWFLKTHERKRDEALLRTLFKLEDLVIEKIPKYINDRIIGLALENALDIVREISLGAGGTGYITEKFTSLAKHLCERRLLDKEICEKLSYEYGFP